MTFYICECGKTHTETEMKKERIWVKEKKSGWEHKICIEHGARIVTRMVKCIDCGEPVYAPANRGGIPKRCKAHAKAQKVAEQLIRSRKQAKEKKAARLELKKKKINGCKWFENVCGFCIQPFFRCEMRCAA